MATINRFQLYSQKENTITNNVLFMFSELYRISPNYFEKYINGLLEEEVYKVQPEFSQQSGGNTKGIIDGLVQIPSSKIIIETKRQGTDTIDKLVKYAHGFKGISHKVLFHLSMDVYAESQQAEIKRLLEQNDEGRKVHFRSITYQHLLDQLDEVQKDYSHDTAISLLNDDFKDYCERADLLGSGKYVLRAMACGQSFDINVKHAFYFDYADRGYSPFNYLGIYKDKAVRYIGEIDTNVVARYEPDKGIIYRDKNIKLGLEQTGRLKAALEEAFEAGWDVDKEHRIFLLNNLTETNYIKGSPGGIYRVRYFNLEQILGKPELMNISTIAQALTNKFWEQK